MRAAIHRAFQCVLTLALASVLLALPASACRPPVAPEAVILTIDGLIRDCDGHFEVQFDLAALQALPRKTIETRNPWDVGLTRYEGVLLRDLMDGVGAHGTVMTIQALDDYHADLPLTDTRRFDILLAYERNGALMKVRDRGPLFVVFPFSGDPQLETETRYAQSVWQVTRITVK